MAYSPDLANRYHLYRTIILYVHHPQNSLFIAEYYLHSICCTFRQILCKYHYDCCRYFLRAVYNGDPCGLCPQCHEFQV